MVNGLGVLYIHTITIEPYLGQSGDGTESFGPAATVSCWVEERRRRVRTQQSQTSTGDEALSEATAYAPLDTSAPVGSRITLPTGRMSYVLTTNRFDGGALPLPSHLEILVA